MSKKALAYGVFTMLFAIVHAISAYKTGHSDNAFWSGLMIMIALLVGELLDQKIEIPVIDYDLSHVKEVALNGDKVKAIKLYRKLSGKGIKDAKSYVESLISTGEK
jgi:hypothetical protein